MRRLAQAKRLMGEPPGAMVKSKPSVIENGWRSVTGYVVGA